MEESQYFDYVGFPASLTVKIREAFWLFRYSPSTIGCYDKATLPTSLTGDIVLSKLIGRNVFAIARKI